MFESSQNWELFGYDMRNLGRHFMAAWRDLLWSYDSPVRSRLDEAVLLRNGGAETIYHAGQPTRSQEARCSAVELPEALALSKTLRLPIAVESDLESVLALEVSANSPFNADDTAFGWRVHNRTEEHLEVILVIISRSSAMTYIGQEYGSHDASAQEAWVSVGGEMVVLQGFGEETRDRYYRKRLIKVGAMLFAAAIMVLVLGATAAAFKRLELERLQDLSEATQREAASASRMRISVSAGNELIAAVEQIATTYPSAHRELARLTELLGDDAYRERFTVNGREIDLRGRAANAAAVMKLLVQQPGYSEVIAASPIRKLPGTSVEQFHLKITIDSQVAR